MGLHQPKLDWFDVASGHIKALAVISPGATFAVCECKMGQCMAHSVFFLRGLFPPFVKWMEKHHTEFLVWDQYKDCYTVILDRGLELVNLYNTGFRIPYNSWIRNRLERLGASVSKSFEDLNREELDILLLSDAKFAADYTLPPRKWSWARTVAQAEVGLTEGRPAPVKKVREPLKSDRSHLNQGGDRVQ
jgi:hypothetical protein